MRRRVADRATIAGEGGYASVVEALRSADDRGAAGR
jgi:hypothetical protein